MQNATSSTGPDSISVLISLGLAIGYLCAICLCIACIPPLCRLLLNVGEPIDKLLAYAAFLRLFGCAFGPTTALALSRLKCPIAPSEPPV